MKGLRYDVRQMDAEELPLADGQFDLVWTWGVIHHSQSTETIVRNMARVLKPGGSLRMMVYYRPSLVYWVHCGVIRGLLMGELLRKSVNQIYVDRNDGFFARAFNRAEIGQLLMDLFEDPRMRVVGGKPELYPIPRTSLKTMLVKATPDWLARLILSRWGSMIYVEATLR